MSVLYCEHLTMVVGLLLTVSGFLHIGFTQQTEDLTDIRLVNGTPTAPNSGRVEVLHTSGIWLTVCDVKLWGANDGTVSCRQLGFPGYSSVRRTSYFGEGTNNGSVGEIGCNSEEERIGQCGHGPVKTKECNGRAAGLICTTPGFLGCYNDRTNRVFPRAPFSSDNMTVELCLERCRGLGVRYAGLEAGRICYCGEEETMIDKYGKKMDRDCQVSCAGNSDEVCGGGMRLSIYDLTLGYCPDLGIPEYGGREPPNVQDGFRYAARISYYCNDGFELVGAVTARCVLGGSPQEVEWDAPLPECKYIPVETTPSLLTEENQSESEDEPVAGLNKGLVAGIVVGSVVLLVLVFLLIFVILRKRNRRPDINANVSNTSLNSQPNGKRYATHPMVPNANTEYQDLRPSPAEPERTYTALRKPDDQRVSDGLEIPEYLDLEESAEYTVPFTEPNERGTTINGATKQPFGTRRTGPLDPNTTEHEYSNADNYENDSLNQNSVEGDSDYYTLQVAIR